MKLKVPTKLVAFASMFASTLFANPKSESLHEMLPPTNTFAGLMSLWTLLVLRCAEARRGEKRSDEEKGLGEAERGAKRRDHTAITSGENCTRSCFHARRALS